MKRQPLHSLVSQGVRLPVAVLVCASACTNRGDPDRGTRPHDTAAVVRRARDVIDSAFGSRGVGGASLLCLESSVDETGSVVGHLVVLGSVHFEGDTVVVDSGGGLTALTTDGTPMVTIGPFRSRRMAASYESYTRLSDGPEQVSRETFVVDSAVATEIAKQELGPTDVAGDHHVACYTEVDGGIVISLRLVTPREVSSFHRNGMVAVSRRGAAIVIPEPGLEG